MPEIPNHSKIFNDDTVLLKMYRQYGKDESLKYLFDELAAHKKSLGEKDFTIGELKSENAELQDYIKGTWGAKNFKKIAKGENSVHVPKERLTTAQKKEWDKDEYVDSLKQNLVSLNKQLLDLKNNPRPVTKEILPKDQKAEWDKDEYVAQLKKNLSSLEQQNRDLRNKLQK